jgi:hypothetical protein
MELEDSLYPLLREVRHSSTVPFNLDWQRLMRQSWTGGTGLRVDDAICRVVMAPGAFVVCTLSLKSISTLCEELRHHWGIPAGSLQHTALHGMRAGTTLAVPWYG